MSAPTAEAIALARQRYLEGAAVSKILAETGMSLGTLYLWLDGGPADGIRLPQLQRRRIVLGKRRKPLTGRVSLVNRLWRTAERQVCDIEDRLRLNQQQPEERERDARLLAMTVKTVRDLRALHAADAEASPENDEGPDNLDDFRRELARKMDAIVAGRTTKAARDSEL
jgi:hypothetical protein